MTPNLSLQMITVANRATPQPLPQEPRRETAMTREGAPQVDPTPAFLPPGNEPAEPAKRSTLSLPHTEHSVSVEGGPSA